MKIRLSRARELLRDRLGRRGVALSTGSLALLLGRETASAALPASLVQTTVHAAATGAASAKAVSLANLALKGTGLLKAKVVAAVAVGVLVAGAATVALRGPDAAPTSVALANFDGPTVPANQTGEAFPSYHFEPAIPDGGVFTAHVETSDAVKGNSLRLRLTHGWLKAQFNPYGKDRWTFARDYVADPAAWRFQTYNRLTFWIKLPAEARAYSTTGDGNLNVGTYCKRVADAHPQNNQAGGGHFYHRFNVPAVGCWARVVVNAHPHLQDRGDPNREVPVQTRPTGEDEYNYFDTLTRFYVEVRFPPADYPKDYLLDEVRFEHQPRPENDRQVYSITATHVPATNRLIVTWSRPKGEDGVKHEVRYAFADIHQLGWEQAKPAPRGSVVPAGAGARNGMVYDTTELPLAGHLVVYLAIKPENAERFAQAVVPLTLK